ncbi:MAG: hypothetical protein RIS29_153 [Bacteroidota bacterium]|jgi:hypothetical protein
MPIGIKPMQPTITRNYQELLQINTKVIILIPLCNALKHVSGNFIKIIVENCIFA